MKQLSSKKIYLIGMMGSGKSHWSWRLAHSFGLPAFDLDRLIEAKEGMTIREVFDTKGEVYFRILESDTLQNGLHAGQFVLSCGGGTPCFFNNLAHMKENGLVIWLNPSVEELVERIKKSPGTRPVLAAVKNDEELMAHLTELLHKRQAWYQQADIIITEDHFLQAELEARIMPFLEK